jgi:N-acetylmuramic acid 6-phosphate etherase
MIMQETGKDHDVATQLLEKYGSVRKAIESVLISH